MSESLQKKLLWVPVLAFAASLGYSASLVRRRLAERPAVATARPAPPERAPDVPAALGVPVAPAPAFAPVASPAKAAPVARPEVARAADLAVYSKFNFVARRFPGIPRVEPRLSEKSFRFGPALPEAPAFSSAAWSFRLMFPASGPVSSDPAPPEGYSGPELAMAVYAETGGVFPMKVASGSVYDPRVWHTGFEPGGYGDLLLARRMIAETRKRNKRTHLKPFPFDLRRLSLLSWYHCADAAEDAVDAELYPLPPGKRLHFFIRQEGVGRRKARYLENFEPVFSFGPFVNVGGGDVPKGDKTYIDFYVLPMR